MSEAAGIWALQAHQTACTGTIGYSTQPDTPWWLCECGWWWDLGDPEDLRHPDWEKMLARPEKPLTPAS